MFKVYLKGARELKAALEELPKTIARAALRRALIKAAQPVADMAGNFAAQTKPELADAIQVKTTLSRRQRRRRPKQGEVEAFIGVTAARRGVAHLIEFGTGPRYHKSGKFTGQMAARPYLRPAWEAGKLKVLNDFGKLIWIEIEKAAKRLAKKAAR